MSVVHKLFNLSGEIYMFEDKNCKANRVYDTVNNFARNLAKCSPILKILSPAEWMINVH